MARAGSFPRFSVSGLYFQCDHGLETCKFVWSSVVGTSPRRWTNRVPPPIRRAPDDNHIGAANYGMDAIRSRASACLNHLGCNSASYLHQARMVVAQHFVDEKSGI
jgi:hypothetical protein